MIWNIICFITPLIFLGVTLWYEKKEHGDNAMVWFFTVMCSIWAFWAYGLLIEYNTPTALDVYRGKTTLEITYRDSVAIDSTVVYKVR